MSAQLELPTLPVAAPEFEREQAVEQRLRYVLGCARSVTRDEDSAPLGWWTAGALAVRMREPAAAVAPALWCLLRRGAVERAGAGVGPDGREVFMWTVRGEA